MPAGTRAKHVEHIRVADVDGVVADGIGAVQGRLEELRIGLGQPHRRGDHREVEVLHQIVVAQDAARAPAPSRRSRRA